MLQESILGRRVGVVFDGKGSRIVSAGTERTVWGGGRWGIVGSVRLN